MFYGLNKYSPVQIDDPLLALVSKRRKEIPKSTPFLILSLPTPSPFPKVKEVS